MPAPESAHQRDIAPGDFHPGAVQGNAAVGQGGDAQPGVNGPGGRNLQAVVGAVHGQDLAAKVNVQGQHPARRQRLQKKPVADIVNQPRPQLSHGAGDVA